MCSAMNNPIVISKCLLGESVRYNGTDLKLDKGLLEAISEYYQIFSFCPEMEGGLPVPRDPAEIQGGDGEDVLCRKARVITTRGDDVTVEFICGAQKILDFCKDNCIKLAVLTERSPSCGSKNIYSGSFDGFKKEGAGVTAALLQKNGIRVVNQYEIGEIVRCKKNMQ